MEDSSDADGANIFSQLILIIILTLINAFFATAEHAILSVNKSKIKKMASEGNSKAKAVEKLLNDETKFLSTIQVGITLAGFFSSAIAAITISDDVAKFLVNKEIPLKYAEYIAMIIVTLILSYFILVFGELLPKRIAVRNPEKISMNRAKTLLILKFIFLPFVKILSCSCNVLVKMFRIDKSSEEEIVTDEDIIDVVSSGVEDGTVDEEMQKMIEGTLKFDHLTATDLMTPRVDVFMIDIDDNVEKNIDLILEEKYSRVPVYKKNRDNIVGSINMKDIIEPARKLGFNNLDLSKIIREPYFVRDLIKADQLFEEMKQHKQQIAFLMDEFGGFSGIVTMEDLIEEIVGNIYDEYDDEANNITQIGKNQYLIKGATPIQEINQELDLDMDEENTEYDTIGGFIVTNINKIPKSGENIIVEYKNLVFKVKDVKKTRILSVILNINPIVDEE